MIEKLLAAALTRPSLARRALRDEVDRLRRGGYLPEDDLEALAGDAAQQLGERIEEARATVGPLLTGAAASLREALDLPSRAEVLALTEELRRAREARGEEPAAPRDDEG